MHYNHNSKYNYNYITLHNTTLHYIIILPYATTATATTTTTTTTYTTLHWTTLRYTTLITLHYNYNSITLQLQLHYTILHPAVVLRWPLQPLQPLQKTQLQPPVGPSVASLCHPWFTTTNLSYRFPIFETSATALCGTTGNTLNWLEKEVRGCDRRRVVSDGPVKWATGWKTGLIYSKWSVAQVCTTLSRHNTR